MGRVFAFFSGWFTWASTLAGNVAYWLFAEKWARRATFVALGVAFFTTVNACVTALLGLVTVSGLPGAFATGLGMVIPSNAPTIVSCLGAIWMACLVYKLKIDAIRW